MSDKKPAAVGDNGVSLTPRSIIGIISGIAALILVFSNTGQVTLKFLWLNLTAPGWLMLLFILLAGFLLGLVFGRRRYKVR